jgi:N-acylneuraminate cytidylyltransferase
MICIIPIRSGSKSIKDKNIKYLNGVPMVNHAFYAVEKSRIFKKIIIATDSQKYIDFLQIKIKSKNVIFFKRSKKTSTDRASTESVLKEVLQKYPNYGVCCLVQATSPLVLPKDFINGFNKFKNNSYDSLFSAYSSKETTWKKENGILRSLSFNYKNRNRRQDFKVHYVENGAFYFFKTKSFLSKNNRLFGKIGIYLMPKSRSLEIDDLDDFNLAQDYFKNKPQINWTVKIKLIISDLDGTITDGSVYVSEKKNYIKFSVVDGHAFKILKNKKIPVIVISSNTIYKKNVIDRIKHLRVFRSYFGVVDKNAFINKIADLNNCKINEIAYLGDDISDLNVMQNNVLSFCPNNAQKEIKNISNYVGSKNGGNGFFREVVNLLNGAKLI